MSAGPAIIRPACPRMQNDTSTNFHRHGRSSRSVRRTMSGASGRSSSSPTGSASSTSAVTAPPAPARAPRPTPGARRSSASTWRYCALVASRCACVPVAATRPSVVHQHDAIGERDRRRPVGDDQRGAAVHHLAPARCGSRAPSWGRRRRWRRRGSAHAGRRGWRGRSPAVDAGHPTARSRARRAACRSRRAASRMKSSAPARRAACTMRS